VTEENSAMVKAQTASRPDLPAAGTLQRGFDEQDLCLPGCRSLQLIAQETGLPYQIFISVPEGEAPPSGFPVIYVLDANSDFITLSETVRRVSRRPTATGIHPAIVVGIGYPNVQAYDAGRRYLDFTQAAPADRSEQDASVGYGGQAAFMRFLSKELLPFIASKVEADHGRRLLIGHSLAGYFVLEVAAGRPDLFGGYISLSPSIWWDKAGLRARLRKTLILRPDIRLYVGVGQYEQEPAPWQTVPQSEAYHALRESRRMVDNARELTQEAASLLDAEGAVLFELAEQEDHATVFTTLLCRALRFAQPRG
jgi:predicted alpha/beta superfamily hydrolase